MLALLFCVFFGSWMVAQCMLVGQGGSEALVMLSYALGGIRVVQKGACQ
jgi:hypothetical protein